MIYIVCIQKYKAGHKYKPDKFSNIQRKNIYFSNDEKKTYEFFLSCENNKELCGVQDDIIQKCIVQANEDIPVLNEYVSYRVRFENYWSLIKQYPQIEEML